MRACEPDVVGTVDRDGVSIGYEVHGAVHASDERPSILLMPTWTIIHARFWKLQIPYLARHHHVVSFDGPGNGASDRVTDSARYAATEIAHDAAAVLDECGVERAVAVGLSRGAGYALALAELRPNAIAGLVLIGPALPLAPPPSERADIPAHFLDPAPTDPEGWDRYNLAYWHENYDDFVEWFFEKALSEPHSTKGREDALAWALETGPDVLQAEAFQRDPDHSVQQVLAQLSCPVLAVHGTDDKIVSHEVGVEAARLTGGTLVSFEGSGHLPNLRDPVRFNLLLHEFVEGIH
jgi:pimeloyl-ACP methyl ester carboxylesterase